MGGYNVIDISSYSADSFEPLGTKSKFWFHSSDGEQMLFKEGRPSTGENWCEKVAAEFCALLDMPHATYELAIWQGKRGVISPSFVPSGASLVHGNELLTKTIKNYPYGKMFGTKDYTLKAVLAIMKARAFGLPWGWIPSPPLPEFVLALDVFIGYLMLDAWIANQDRHHENWGFLVFPGKGRYLAPTYDHASGLGRNLTDEFRYRCLTTNDTRQQLEAYVKRAKSAFFTSSEPQRRMGTVEAFHEAGKMRPLAAHAWLERLEAVSSSRFSAIFEKLPPDEITPIAVEFACKMLSLNRQRLLYLKGKFQ